MTRGGGVLTIGDEVIIRAKVKSITPGEEFCNCTVETVPMPPYKEPYSITLNTRQVEKVEAAPPAASA